VKDHPASSLFHYQHHPAAPGTRHKSRKFVSGVFATQQEATWPLQRGRRATRPLMQAVAECRSAQRRIFSLDSV
jgi:hypothetical protein